MARSLLLDILEIELPVGTEFLDLLSPQFISDLVRVTRGVAVDESRRSHPVSLRGNRVVCLASRRPSA